MTEAVEAKPTIESEIIAFPEEKAQDLVDSAVVLARSTGKRVQLITNRHGSASFLIGDRQLRTRKPDITMRKGFAYNLR